MDENRMKRKLRPASAQSNANKYGDMVAFAARAAIRGGNFNGNGGVFTLNVNNLPSNANNNIGFRAGKHTGFFSQTKGHSPFAVQSNLEPWPSPNR